MSEHDDEEFLSEDVRGPDPYPRSDDPADNHARDDTSGYPPSAAHSPNRPVEYTQILCVQCGYNLTGVSIGQTCPECGARVDLALFSAASTRANGKAIASMVLGICALVMCCCPGPILAILGLIFGKIALDEMQTGGFTPGSRSMAIAGLWCSGIALVLGAGYWLLVLI